ncbi:hypothetical protein UA11_04659 [Burkholderia multivorans]|nr:hypothetical protein UA11_04659 [Burkholderia multivorans]
MSEKVHVQFSDSDETTIVSYFASPQDPTVYANLGDVDTSDARWTAFYLAAGGPSSGLPAATSADQTSE